MNLSNSNRNFHNRLLYTQKTFLSTEGFCLDFSPFLRYGNITPVTVYYQQLQLLVTYKNTIMTKIAKQRVTLFLNPGLLKQAKIQAIIEERSLTALIEEALVKYLPKKTIPKKAAT